MTALAMLQELNLALAGYTGSISAANSAASSAVRSRQFGVRLRAGEQLALRVDQLALARKVDTVPANMPTMPGTIGRR